MVDSDMLEIHNLDYMSNSSRIFHKMSVIVGDFMLVFGLVACFWNEVWCKREQINSMKSVKNLSDSSKTVVLVMLNGGLILVDHIHFQYNGMLLGMLLISVGLIIQGHYKTSSLVFAALLMLKHLYLCMAPLYFIYLLKAYCLHGIVATNSDNAPSTRQFWKLPFFKRFLMLGVCVLSVFAISVGSLCVSSENHDGRFGSECFLQLNQMVKRLFPFGRGIVHSYWAPNSWAIYFTFDRFLLCILKLLGVFDASDLVGSVTGGLEGDKYTAVLPAVTPLASGIIVLLSMSLGLKKIFQKCNPESFIWGMVYSAMCAFMFGWHVHEKAILSALIPLSLVAPQGIYQAHLYRIMSMHTYLSLLPLLPGPSLCITRFIVLSSSIFLSYYVLKPFDNHLTITAVSKNFEHCDDEKKFEYLLRKKIWCIEKFALGGCAAVYCFYELIHPVFFKNRELPFLPLMVVSFYCAAWFTYCWILSLSMLLRLKVSS